MRYRSLLALLFLALLALPACDSGGGPEESNEAPTAQFSFAPQNPLAGSGVAFTSQSSDSDGQIESYSWDFNGDDAEDASGPNPSFTFPSDGAYTTTLTVTDDGGETASASKTVSVAQANQSPSADFSYSPGDPRAGRQVSFANQSSDPDGQIDSYSWDFDGDGTEDASSENPTYTFDGQGTYTASLTVTDEDGGSASTSQNISVSRQFNTVTIISVAVEEMPFSTDEGGGWDFGGSGPDVYYELSDEDGNTLSSSDYYSDVAPADLPLTWSEDVTISDLSAEHTLRLLDSDYDADDEIAALAFTLDGLVGDYPSTVPVEMGDVTFELGLSWSVNGSAIASGDERSVPLETVHPAPAKTHPASKSTREAMNR